ncbi:MAG: DUF6471 domain-containing protein [Methylococcales bacterium]
MHKSIYWKSEALQIIRAAKARKGLDWNEVARRLNNNYDMDIDAKGLSAKISQGTFSFVFALQVLSSMGVESIEIPLNTE